MEFLVKPWAHQLEAFERAKTLPYFGLFFDPGIGKSAAVINMLRWKMNVEKRFLKTVIFSPGVVIDKWKTKEFAQHSKVPLERVILLQGSGKKRLELFRKYSDKPSIFIMNHECFLMPELMDAIWDWQPEAFVIDESHGFKNPKAERSKVARVMANPFDKQLKVRRPLIFKAILSGTPVLNSPLDIFQQMYILDGGETFGENYYAFRARYFADENARIPKREGVYVPEKWVFKTYERDGFEAQNEFTKRLSHHTMYAEKEKCLDLPPLTSIYRRVEMTPDQARMYKEMKRDFVTYVESNQVEDFEGDVPPVEAVVANMAVTKLIRLMQIASGYCKTERGRELSLKETPKMKALKEQLEELTPKHKVIIWTIWKDTYESIRHICEKLKIKYVEVHGDISDRDKQKNVRSFEEDPEVRVIFGHPRSGGIGVDLVASDYTIYYSLGFSLGDYIQSRDRNHRGGSEKHEKITHMHLVCKDTVDELVREKLVNKQKMSKQILLDLAKQLK